MSSDERGELFEHAACGLLATESNGTILHVNQTLCSWLGYHPDELVGKRRLQDLLTIGCKIFHQTHWMPLLQMQGSVAEVQLEFVHRDGTVLPVLVNALRRDESGRVRDDIAVIVATDRRKYERELLAARKRAEQLLASERSAQAARMVAEANLRLALDSAHLFVWSVEPTSAIPSYEPGVRHLLGLPAEETFDAQVYEDSIHPDDREMVRDALRTALTPAGQGRYFAEYRLRTRQGDFRIVSSSGRADFDQDGRLERFSGVLQDVTSWRNVEGILRERENEAQQRAILAEQVVGIVSHDLRTPLNAVVLGVNLLGASEVSPAQRRTISRISSAAQRASRLVTDLLDFTQARLGGGLPIQPTEFSLHELVHECIEELRLAWPGRMIEHRAQGDDRAYADVDRLAQVVSNLTNNALTYGTPEHPVVITSECEAGQLVVQVHNQGVPIPEKLLPHLFEPLRRGEQQVKLGSRSVGLGLYIVQQIARAHGGQVAVRSAPDLGTTFTVSLPARQP